MATDFFPQRPNAHPMIYAYEDTNPQYQGTMATGVGPVSPPPQSRLLLADRFVPPFGDGRRLGRLGFGAWLCGHHSGENGCHSLRDARPHERMELEVLTL